MRLNYKQTVLIGFAFMSILAFWQFYDQVIPFLLERVFSLDTFAANAIMSIDNVLSIFMLPFFGSISDRTNTRLGRRTPYILVGTLVAVCLVVVLGIFTEVRSFYGFFFTLMALLFVMATYRTPAVAYMPDVTEKPLRSKANAVINFVGYIGAVFSTVVMMLMLKSRVDENGEKVYLAEQSFFPVFITVAVFMLAAVLIMVIFVKENKLKRAVDTAVSKSSSKEKLSKPVMRSLALILASVFLWFMAYNAVTTAFSRYCYEIWGTDLGTSSGYLLMATIAAIIAFVPLGFLSSTLGRKKTVLIGILLMTACYFAAALIRAQTSVMYALFGIVGIGWAAINVNSFPMVVEMCSGSDVGKYTGFYYTFSMAAQITTPLLSGWLIDNLGLGYSVLFPYAVLFSLLSFVTMLFVKHGDSKPQRSSAMLEGMSSED